MRFYFTEEDRPTEIRARDIRAALVNAHHQVIHGRLGDPVPSEIDFWMYGIGIAGSPPINGECADLLLASRVKFALFQTCDHRSMCFEQIPHRVAERAQLFLRSHWPSDRSAIPADYRDRVGFLTPMVKPMVPSRGRDLAQRRGNAIFYGTRTGMTNLPGGKNAREECVRIMLASGLPFVGGIVPHSDPRYETDPALIVPKISDKRHQLLLSDARVCLAPWGNHPITYRLFEGLAMRCLVVAQSLRETTFIDGGLEAGRDYVEVAPDFGDLAEKVRYYLENLDEAQRIADSGHRHFSRYLAARGRLVSSHIFENTVASWGNVYSLVESRNLASTTRSILAQLNPKWF